jgi:pyrimidine-nucleoside phosphorylase
MRFVDVIVRKRDGHALARAEIDAFIAGVIDGSIPDYQISALMMAILLRGMTREETGWLTEAMVRSGERVDLSAVPGIKVGKHSTGGVGDKVSLVLAPLVAACGVPVPKMSGRGLGHSGGTLDKLESIPGFRVDLSIEEFRRILADVGTSIIGQTLALAPADKKLYALRDVTATISSVPLIAASIMSKKLAEGADALVLDVKCGDGAFVKDVRGAEVLARSMVAIGTHAGVRTEAFITAMDAPLGRAVGNAVELIEALDTLKGGGPDDLTELVLHLAARMIVLGGAEPDSERAMARARAALSSGRALTTFERMVERHGGRVAVIYDYALLPGTPHRAASHAVGDGFVTGVRAEAIGRAANLLGAGRSRMGDPVDHAVGVVLQVKPGDEVRRGDVLVELRHRDGTGLEEALAACAAAVLIGDAPSSPGPLVLGEVR